MLSPYKAWGLRAVPSEQLVEQHAGFTRVAFRSLDAVPVVIAARNEQEDIPATLVALAGNTRPVAPYVVVNCSTDETAFRARKMGARVMMCDEPLKLPSLQQAVGEITAEASQRNTSILFTDADTLTGRRWAESMTTALTTRPQISLPGLVLGSSLFSHGGDIASDVARSLNKIIGGAVRQVQHQRPKAHGHNMAMDFAGSSEALKAYMGLSPLLFIGEEEAIVDVMQSHHAQVIANLSLAAMVLTRGDRFTYKDLWRLRNDRNFEKRKKLYGDYGAVETYFPAETIDQQAKNGLKS